MFLRPPHQLQIYFFSCFYIKYSARLYFVILAAAAKLIYNTGYKNQDAAAGKQVYKNSAQNVNYAYY